MELGERFETTFGRTVQWGRDRGIIPHGTPAGQAKKTVEEACELRDAIGEDDDELGQDAVGDTIVALIMTCTLKGWSIIDCFERAYNEIKDRRGQMGTDGIFYRVGQTMPDGTVVE